MALKTFNPTTPSQRQLVIVDRSQLYKGAPVKTLTEGQNSTGGRNNHGRITSRFRGGSDLTIYLEGDGYNWINRYTPSSDPTPVTPIVLELAVQDPSSNGLYLARPCQYLAARDLARCNPDFWLDRRYAPEVVAAIDQSISEGKRRSGAQTVTLVGVFGLTSSVGNSLERFGRVLSSKIFPVVLF